MKIAITGKGGSGKTTVSSGLAILFKDLGKEVIAVDCDPDMTLALSLGLTHPQKITPIASLKSLISERTQTGMDNPSGFFKINPKVDDIPDKFSADINGIKILVMGEISKAGGGCLCPENTFLRRLLSHLLLEKNEVVILDMVAGSEHLGRATAESVDANLIVVEPNFLSLSCAKNIYRLAKELGIRKNFFIGNKIQSKNDSDFLKTELKVDYIGDIHYNANLAALRGRFSFEKDLRADFESILKSIKKLIGG